MSLPITTLSVSILGILLVILSMRIIAARRAQSKAPDSDEIALVERRVRGQGNLIEYAPLGALLILVAELQSANQTVLAVLASAFVIARLLHGYTFGFTKFFFFGRFFGTLLTLISILALAALNLWMLI